MISFAHRSTTAAIFVALLATPAALHAQIRASELAVVAQTIDGTRITVEYSRPRARGRDTLFGTRFVRWGETWTPGANWATTLEVNKGVTVNGVAVPKGKYSVWMVVREKGDWTVVLDPKSHQFHMHPPDSSITQIRFAAHPEPSPFTEMLTWSVPDVRANGGTLAMQWERVRVPLDVRVEPSLVMTLTSAEAAPYLGEYKWSWTDTDSSGKAPAISTLTITHEDGILRGRWTPEHPYFKKFALIRIGPDWFAPGVYNRKGELYEVLKPDETFEFKRVNGKPTSVVMRDEEDHVDGTGARAP